MQIGYIRNKCSKKPTRACNELSVFLPRNHPYSIHYTGLESRLIKIATCLKFSFTQFDFFQTLHHACYVSKDRETTFHFLEIPLTCMNRQQIFFPPVFARMTLLLSNAHLLVRSLKRLCHNSLRILNFNCMINKWRDVFLAIVYIKPAVVALIHQKTTSLYSMCKTYRFS